MKLMTRNPKMAAMYGKKPDAVDKMIQEALKWRI